MNSKKENSLNFCLDFVHEFCLCTGLYNLSSIYQSLHSMEHTKTELYSVRDTETHVKRQATRHDCLPSLLVDGYERSEIVYDEKKNMFYWAE